MNANGNVLGKKKNCFPGSTTPYLLRGYVFTMNMKLRNAIKNKVKLNIILQ